MLGNLEPMPVRRLRTFVAFVFALVTVGLLSFFARVARAQVAQSIDVSSAVGTSYPRFASDGVTPIQKRPQNLTPDGISYQDCVSNVVIQFPLVMSGIQPNDSAEAWASVTGDCSQSQFRSGAQQTCWKLASIPLETTYNLPLSVQAILQGAVTPLMPNNSPSICGEVPYETIEIYFLYFPAGTAGQSTSVSKNVQLTVSTVGPAPPTGLSILPGNGRLQISWNNISGEGGVSALTGVAAYCDIQGAASITTTTDASTQEVCESGVDDSGDATDAGCTTVTVDGSTTTQPVSGCASPNFVNGDGGQVIPDQAFNAKYLCGSLVGSTGSSLYATSVGGQPLVNETHYAVSVAGTDQFGNVGPLSAPVCDFPEQTTDFWNNYRGDGGGAGGGFCSLSVIGVPIGGAFGLALSALVGLSILRRRWRR